MPACQTEHEVLHLYLPIYARTGTRSKFRLDLGYRPDGADRIACFQMIFIDPQPTPAPAPASIRLRYDPWLRLEKQRLPVPPATPEPDLGPHAGHSPMPVVRPRPSPPSNRPCWTLPRSTALCYNYFTHYLTHHVHALPYRLPLPPNCVDLLSPPT